MDVTKFREIRAEVWCCADFRQVRSLLPRCCISRSITFIQQLSKKCLNLNNLTLLHDVSRTQKRLICYHAVLQRFDSLIMVPCGPKE